jgi:uncharacterized surface protein with fasciclin (FAS1) repeats
MKKVLLSAVAVSLVLASTVPSFAGWLNKNEGPTERMPAKACGMKKAASTESMSIAQVAMSNPELSTLVTALKAAGLAETFMLDGNYTVFAPTNDAFDHLPPGVLDTLLMPENREKLREVLMYHVLNSRTASMDLPEKRIEVKTLQGAKASVDKSASGNVTIDDAYVTKANIKASNGVIHVIDRVIMP